MSSKNTARIVFPCLEEFSFACKGLSTYRGPLLMVPKIPETYTIYKPFMAYIFEDEISALGLSTGLLTLLLA